jgi:hypothetical protein
MKAIVLGAALAVASSPALTQSRPFTPRLPCQAVASIVRSNVAVVLSTGPNTYDRYVRDRTACYPSQVLKPAWVVTADTSQCFIGYTCIESERTFGN